MKKQVMLMFLLLSLNIFAINISEVMKMAKKVTREKYPNSHYVLVDELKFVNYKDDGTQTYEDEYYIKIMDEEGKEDQRSFSMEYNKNYQTVGYKFVKLIKPNGVIVKIDIKENLQDKVSPSSQGSNIYDENGRILTLNIPGIEVGDIVAVKEYSKVFKPRINREFADYTYAESYYPIVSLTSVVKAPLSNPLEVSKVLNAKKGLYTLEQKFTKNNIIYTFRAKNVPQIIPEPSMPPFNEVAMKWGVSTTKNWEEISKWYYYLTEPKMKITDDIKKITDNIIKDTKTDKQKIEKIFFWVSRNIRYLGITLEENRPGLEPHEASYTCDSRTGVCRDKAALIVTMLRYAGFEANMVLMNASRKMDEKIPTSFFNHAIAGVKFENKYLLMDPTDETTKVLFPEYLMDKSYLVATKDGSALETSPIKPADENILYIKNDIDVKDDKYKIKTLVTFLGINDNAYRDYFLNLNEKQKKDFLRRVLTRMTPDTKLLDYKIYPKNLSDPENLEISMTYEVNDVVTGKDFKMLEIVKPGDYMGMYNFILANLSLSKRKYPIRISSTAAVFEVTEINYKGEILALPKNIDYFIPSDKDKYDSKKNKFEYKVDFENSKNKIKIIRYRKLNDLDYSLKDYYNLREIFGKIENYEKKEIIIK